MGAMQISLTALDVEWRRMEVIAENLANAGTALDPTGGGYRPMQVVSGPKTNFSDLANITPDQLQGVEIVSLQPENVAPHQVYEPQNPLADVKGFVSYSGVDHAAEMLLMAKTSRIYEANIAAFNAARQMYGKALEIGKR